MNLLENKFTHPNSFVLQYFKMDPENFDEYGGVEHVEYCLQVNLL